MRRNVLVLITILVITTGALSWLVQAAETQNTNRLREFFGRWRLPQIFRGEPQADSKPPAAEPIGLYRPVLDYEEAVVQVVEGAAPSVVSIIITKDLPVIEQCSFNPFSDLPPEFRQFFEADIFGFSRPCPKGTKRQEVGGGTGFVIDEAGLLLTNKHVISDPKAEYTVVTTIGEKYKAEVVALDPVQDLGILRIKGNGQLKPLSLGNSDEVKLGQTAIAIGNALSEFRNTVSVGVVSGLARRVTASGPGLSEVLEGVIQTDAAINPGNSGGPLLNLRGEVIGINTAVAQGAENIGFAIPVNKAKRAIESIKRTGKIVLPYLGVRYLTIDDQLADKEKLPVKRGALIRGNEEGPAVMMRSPAAIAGLQAEDIIVELNGEPVDEQKNLSSLIQKYHVGDSISLKVRRGSDIITLRVTLTERPQEE